MNDLWGNIPINIITLIVVWLAVFFISFAKGAFGGGYALIGIPLMSLVMDPLQAGVLLAPLFLVMDVIALRYWKPSSWSRIDIKMLLVPLALGIGAGYLLISRIPQHVIEIIMALLVLLFAGLSLRPVKAHIQAGARSRTSATLAGFSSGIASMLAHSGGLPLSLYLMHLGLNKTMYASTASILFTFSNVVKIVPWLIVAPPLNSTIWLFALSMPAAILGVWSGWQLHQRLNQKQFYRVCMTLVILAAFKLLWDGVKGF
jgi:uncharacterized protein